MIFANKSKAQSIEMEDAQNGQAGRREAGGVTKNAMHARSKDAVHESERQRQLHRNLSKFSNKRGQLLRLFSGVNLTDQNQDSNEPLAY